MSRILCIHSLTAHGTVGLKAFIATLGHHCIPVPSLLLTGPGDMPGCQRIDYDFEAMLRGALAAAIEQRARLTVFVGYLARAEQVEIIVRALDDYAVAVSSLWIDPVSGDRDRAYVSAALIAEWPRLLGRATWAFPNVTEAELLSGVKGRDPLAALSAHFPRLNLVVTGRQVEEMIETRLLRPGKADVVHRQPAITGHTNGTGDLFAAVFARALLIDEEPSELAVKTAAKAVAVAIERGQQQGAGGLILS